MERESFLHGDFSSLPPLQTNLVRIFTSSTFTDMCAERNYLIQNIYPKLREYCQKLGMEFEVVDMRWGVNDDMSADHMTTKLCLREITNSQRLSEGPNFVALLGDKYGYCPIPSEIQSTEFEILLSQLKDEDKTIFHQWFWQDTNNKPPVHVLQPITTYYPDYNNMDDLEAKKKDRDSWWKDFTNLKRLLKEAVRLAVLKGLLDEAEEEKYNISVTETEVQKGVLQARNPNKKCLCFIRVFTGIDDVLSLDDVQPFIDMDDSGGKDVDARKRSQSLRFEKLRQALCNLNCFDVSWVNGGINEKVKEHQVYLKNLGLSYIDKAKRLIDKHKESMVSFNDIDSTCKEFLKESLSHAWFCVSKCKTFCGREIELDAIKNAVTGPDSHWYRVIVLHGHSGCGKTALVAKVVENLKLLYFQNIDIVLRFLGTTPDSSNCHSLLKSLLQQVCHVRKTELPSEDRLNDLNSMVQDFCRTLTEVSKISEKRLAIVLDSLDQLSPADNALLLQWLPRNIPANVLLILSTIGDYENLLTTIKGRYKKKAYYLEVKPLAKNTADTILQNYFRIAKRTVTPKQYSNVMDKLTKCSEPLLLKLLFDEASNWRSYEEIQLNRIGDNVCNAICNVFERLERTFGKVLISHVFGYIAASKSGLSEVEIEDILSLDNDVLDQVYAYWDPPINGVIRLPPLLWKRIRYEMEEYLIERQADGVTVLNWYHRQFHEESTRRYLAQNNDREKRSEVIADYFLGTYANNTPKPITLTKRGHTQSMMTRQVSAQPLMFSQTCYNLRKLSELPSALLEARNFSVLYEQVLFNFRWILTKMKATTVYDVLQDYKETLKVRYDYKLQQVFNFLKLANSNLQQDPESLASQLLGRMSYISKSSSDTIINRLLSDARRWCSAHTRPILMPRRTCMTTPGGFLVTTFKGHLGRVYGVVYLKEGQEMISLSKNGNILQINIWIIESMTQKAVFSLNTECDPLFAVPSKEEFVIVGCSDRVVKISLLVEDVEATLSYKEQPSVFEMGPSEEALYIGFTSGCVRQYQVNELLMVAETVAHNAPVSCISLDAKSFLYVGYSDGQVQVFNTNCNLLISYEKKFSSLIHLITTVTSKDCFIITTVNGEVFHLDKKCLETQECTGNTGCLVWCSCFSDNIMFLGCSDGRIRSLAIATGNHLQSLKAHDKEVTCLHIPKSNKRVLISGSKDDTVCITNLERFEVAQRFVGHSSWIACITSTAHGDYILSGSNDKNVKVWKWSEAANEGIEITGELYPHEKSPYFIRMTDNAQFAVSGSADKCHVWDLSNAKLAHSMIVDTCCVDVGHDNASFVVGTLSGSIFVYSFLDYHLQMSYEEHNTKVVLLKLLSDNLTCLLGLGNGVLDLVDIVNGRSVESFKCHDNMMCLQIYDDVSPMLAATADKEKNVKIWQIDPERKEGAFTCLHSIKDDSSYVLCMRFTQNGEYLVTGSRSGFVSCIKTDTGSVLARCEINKMGDSVVSLVPYKNSIILGSHAPSKNLVSWNPFDNKVERNFLGHTHSVMCLLVTEDQKFLISGSRDGTLKAWDAASGNLLDSIDVQSQVKHCAVSQRIGDFYRVAATGMSGSILLVDFLLNDGSNKEDGHQELQSEKPVKLYTNISSDEQTPVSVGLEGRGRRHKVNRERGRSTISRYCSLA